MKLLIHDLEERFREVLPDKIDDVTIISNYGNIHHCNGCFGCWIKTPGTCVIRDKYGDMGEYISKCNEIIIISECFYGGFSPFVKNVMDRSISYIHPYFAIRNGELHHKRRYNNHFCFKVFFYGENITETEKETAEKLIRANAINFDCSVKTLEFIQNINEIKGFVF